MNSQNIKIFCKSIPKDVRVKQFNQFIKTENVRIQIFPAATSRQFQHYLDENFESTTDTVVLYVGKKDLLKIISTDHFINFMKNVEHMAQKCRCFRIKYVFFISDIVYPKGVAWQILNDVHDRLLGLCKRLDINYIDNRNIREAHFFKDGVHLLDAGKRILAKNFLKI